MTKGWVTMCQNARLMSPKHSQLWETTHLSLDPGLAGTESPLLQLGTLKTLQMKTSSQGSQKFSREILLPFIKIVISTDKLALALVNKLPASTQSKRGLWLINPWISNLKYLGSNLCLKFLFLWTASMCFQLLTCTFRRAEQ